MTLSSTPTVGSVLQRIVDRTRADLALRRAALPATELEQRITHADRDFRAALAAPGLGLIAEFKPASPSRGPIRPDADPDVYARIYDARAAAISVLCDGPFFGGGLHLLERFRARTTRPLLAKGFFVDPYQVLEARAHGADAILLLADLLGAAGVRQLQALAADLGMAALVEVHDAAGLDAALQAGATVIGINNRDLRTLAVDPEHALRLVEQVPAGIVRVAESGIDSRPQVDALRERFDAALIGSAFMRAEDPAARLQELGW